jgi:hypothetical protein
MIELSVKLNGSELLYVGAGENVLVPTLESERQLAFDGLMKALAILAGLRPPASLPSTEVETDGRSPGSEQYHGAQRGGDVVHLAERLVARNEKHPV